MKALDVPLHDPDFYRGAPHAALAELRARSPVHWHGEGAGGFWAITRWADVRFASIRPDLFSSAQGVMIPDPAEIGPGDLDLMLFTDPPRHRELRGLLKGFFAPRRIGALEPRIREIARAVLSGVGEGDEVEFVDAIAAPLPTLVIAELLGIESADWPDFRAWSDAIIGVLDPDEPGDREQAQGALHEYFLRVIEDRRRRPRPDDFVSELLAAQIAGRPLTPDEVYCFCWLLLTAGNETTRNLISLGTWALLRHPEQLAIVVDEPAVIPTAIEEMMRWCTPTTYMGRTATREVSLRGQTIQPGQKVVMLYISANRDEEVFGPDAEDFVVTRCPNPHLSFGFGEHVCMGARLARLEARVLFEELGQRLAHAELLGPVQRLRASMVPGVTHMDVRFTS